MRVAVIGAGVFGCLAALRLTEAGHAVVLFERQAEPLRGASYHNQNRLHLGYHYPRDEETARQCIAGFHRFRQAFGPCLLSPSESAYFVASEGSRTTPADYLAFADRLGQATTGEAPPRIDLGAFQPEVRGVACGVLVPECIYDGQELRALLRERLSGVEQRYLSEVTEVRRTQAGFSLLARPSRFDDGGFAAVVDCTYADTNRLGATLGHAPAPLQYEYTAVAVLDWDQPPRGITVLDGPFFSVVPFGKTGRFLLYHVAHSVLAEVVAGQMPPSWRDQETAPAVPSDLAERLLGAARPFLPALGTARPAGYLQGPRVVLPGREATDARPSLVSCPEPGFVRVFSGKIDHCMWAADEVVARIGGRSA